jgi:hypothetical protein
LQSKLRQAFNPANGGIKFEVHKKPYPKPPKYKRDSRRWFELTLVCSSGAPVYGPEIGILIGEILHNCRGALDHLAWILVQQGNSPRLPVRKERRVMFPMAQTRDTFWARIEATLPGVPDEQRRFIERYQPYRRSTKGRAIRCLRNLSDTDKHRVIIPSFASPTDAEIDLKSEGGHIIHSTGIRLSSGRQIKKGTRILSVIFAETRPGKGKVRVKDIRMGGCAAFPTWMVRPPPGRDVLPVDTALTDIQAVCTEVINEFEVYLSVPGGKLRRPSPLNLS